MFVEQKIDFSKFVKGGFGTSDCIIINGTTIHVIDFKYGKGVEVDAVNNTQMMIYGIGALEMFDGIFDINRVVMTIFQPRLSNVSTFEMSKQDLYHWAFTVLQPAAELAYQGAGTLKCGDHCRFCKAKSVCRARAEYNLKLAQYDFKMPETLEDIEIESLLGRLDMFIKWAEDVKEYALEQAVHGKKWNGYKLVEGKSNRKYTDETIVAERVSTAGYDPYEKKVLPTLTVPDFVVGFGNSAKQRDSEHAVVIVSSTWIATRHNKRGVRIPKEEEGNDKDFYVQSPAHIQIYNGTSFAYYQLYGHPIFYAQNEIADPKRRNLAKAF